MKSMRWWVALLGIALTTAPGVAWSPAGANAASGAETRRGDALVADSEGIRPAEDPADQMQRAHDSFARGDRQAAAEHLQRAAALMRERATRAPGDVKSALLDSARDLDEYARLVASGTATSADELDRVLARASHGLAQYHYLRAAESWARSSTAETGRELRAAADLAERAAVWTGHKVETAALAAVNEARGAASKLLDGAGGAREEIDRAIAGLGREIRTLGQDIETRP